MTREEAIKILKGAIKKPNTEDGYIGQALSMAISALEQEPCGSTYGGVSWGGTYKPQEPCEEFINVPRKALKYRATDFVGYNVEWLKKHWQMEMDIVCGVKPCEDAISRQIISDYVENHIQEINTGYGDLNKHTNEILRMIIDYIEGMPPVTPSRQVIEDIKNEIKSHIIESNGLDFNSALYIALEIINNHTGGAE